MKLSTAIKRFNIQLKADGKSRHTRGAYVRDLQRLRIWLEGDPEVGSVTPNELAQHLAEISKDCAVLSLNRTKAALRMFFKFLTEAGYLKSNPARLIKNGRTEPKIPEYLKPVEARRFLAAIPTNDGPVVRRDHLTGL